MDKLKVTLSVPDPKRFKEVMRAARGHGMTIEKTFPTLGIVTGAVERSRLGALRALSGVGGVEEGRVYQTPRPV